MKQLIIILLLIFLTSCYKIERPEKPMHLLSKEKMVAILVEVSLMNSAKNVNKGRIEKKGIIPDQYIYKKHGIDSITFAKSNIYYAYEISQYQEIYQKVKDSLEKLKIKYEAISEKEKKIKDSIKKTKKNNSKKLKQSKSKKLSKSILDSVSKASR